ELHSASRVVEPPAGWSEVGAAGLGAERAVERDRLVAERGVEEIDRCEDGVPEAGTDRSERGSFTPRRDAQPAEVEQSPQLAAAVVEERLVMRDEPLVGRRGRECTLVVRLPEGEALRAREVVATLE